MDTGVMPLILQPIALSQSWQSCPQGPELRRPSRGYHQLQHIGEEVLCLSSENKAELILVVGHKQVVPEGKTVVILDTQLLCHEVACRECWEGNR